MSQTEKYKNHFYSPKKKFENNENILNPNANLKSMKIWKEHFFRISNNTKSIYPEINTQSSSLFLFIK